MPGDMPGTSKARKVERPAQGRSPNPSGTSAPPTGGRMGPSMPTANNARSVAKPNQGNAPTTGDRPNPPTGGSKGPVRGTADNPHGVERPSQGDNSYGARPAYRKTIGSATLHKS